MVVYDYLFQKVDIGDGVILDIKKTKLDNVNGTLIEAILEGNMVSSYNINHSHFNATSSFYCTE